MPKPVTPPDLAPFGSFDAWVDRDVLPGIESGALERRDMVELVACLRRWETDGTWEGA